MTAHQGGVCCAQVTCFSDSEEDAVGKSKVVPFMPETRLRELGGLYEKVQPDLKTCLLRCPPLCLAAGLRVGADRDQWCV